MHFNLNSEDEQSPIDKFINYKVDNSLMKSYFNSLWAKIAITKGVKTNAARISFRNKVKCCWEECKTT